MRRKFNSTQRNYIIMGLCAILVIMGVGYAAFQSQLKISGTSNITSDFAVRITSITPNSIVGGAADKPDVTTHTDTTATFGTTLQSPGDSITYDVVIENQGTIDAVLKTINKTDTSNSAILFETSGVNEGDELGVGESATMKVKVTYNPAVTSQPTNLESSLKVTLDYEQSDGAIVPSVPTTTVGGQEVEIVSSGDGLYEDSYEAGRYVYKGANPNNYIEFDNGEVWRIVAKEVDGAYKILKNDLLSNQAWDTSMSNNWTSLATLNIYLNGEYLRSLDTSIKDNIVSYIWGIGFVEDGNDDLSAQIASEKETTWGGNIGSWDDGNIGLIAHSDYLRANSDMTNCGTNKTNYENYETCRNTDWMYISGSNWWTISPLADNPINVWSIFDSGRLSINRADNVNSAPRPAAYLKSDITFSGSGTLSDPYKIVS